MQTRIRVRHGMTHAHNEAEAIADIHSQIAQDGTSVILFFCSPKYDLKRLACELRGAFSVPLVGCTSSGQIGPNGFQRGGMSAVSIASRELSVRSFPIPSLASASTHAAEVAALVHAASPRFETGRRAFGLLLIDGLSLAEERVAASLYQALGDVPLVGGSAGDDLAFEETRVFVDGEFMSDAALFTLFETTLPFRAFKFQHFVPTDSKMVITAAHPDARIVTEINGEPAADEYARMLGVATEQLTAEVFSRHPVMLKLDGEYYVRSIQRKNADRSLTFFCAIEEGLVLDIGRGVDVIETLEAGLRPSAGQEPSLVIGCDCILRRLEFEQKGLDNRVGEVLARNRVFGFSTYGEQFNAIHVNQTFTGVSLGG